MTILKIDKIQSSSKRKKINIFLKCDQCNKEYVCEERYKRRAKKSLLHFCSKECSNKSLSTGKLKDRTKTELIAIYGSYYTGTVEFKKQQEDLCMSLYGVKNRLKASVILEKIKLTNLQKYGKEIYAGTEDWESKLDREDIANKAWETKIKNGTCSKSAPEEKLNSILENEFGKNDIKRQYRVIRQWVDFYIMSLDLYIQVDGVYWHGLNRDVNVIKQEKTSQDKKIYKQILRDEKLNSYMKENDMKILRLTDEKVNTSSSEELINIIRSA